MKNKKKKQLLHNYLKECAENRGIANIKRFDDYEGKVIKYFETTKSSIEKEITFIISKIADDNKLSFSEAKKLLNSEELKTFRLNLSEYLDRDKDSLSDNVIKFIENYQSIQRISKLQSMNIHLTVEVDKLFNKYKDGTTEYLTEAYKSNYYHSIYDLQRVTSFSKMIKPSSSKIAIALSKSWVSDNLKYNERIDKNRNYLINELQTELAQTLTTGVNIDEAVKRLSKKLDISKNSAVNLIQSELTAISSNAELDSYKELGIDRYENIATLDTRTSAKCREMDGTVFATSDFEPGVTASPFHWRCRSTTAPYYEKILQGTRAARDSEGNSILVSSDMKYQEWYDKYITSNPKALLEEKMYKNRFQDRKQYQNYKDILGKEAPRSFEDFKDLKYNNSKKWDMFKSYKNSISTGELTALADFKLYEEIDRNIDRKIVGQVTSNGMMIKSKSKHFISRVIGSLEQKRSGVEISDIVEALNNPEKIHPIRGIKKKSQRFDTVKCRVSINPDTGVLIQVNPL